MSGTPGTRLPVPGFSDSLGTRVIVRGAGGAVEVLRVAPALAADASFETAVREGIGRLASFAHPSCGRVRRLDRLADGSGAFRLHSDYVEGNRLSEILLIAEHQRLPINTSAVLDILRQVVSAVAGLHDHVIGGFHGVLGPERLVLRADAKVVVVEHVFAPALRRMPERSPVELWRDWRLAVPSDPALPRFGPLTDLVQVGAIAVALLIGRLLRTSEYPGRLRDLLDAASESDLVGSRRPLSRPLRDWIEAVLQLNPERRFRTMGEARQCLEAMLSDESQFIAAPIALDTLLRPRHHRIRVVRQRLGGPAAVPAPEVVSGPVEMPEGGELAAVPTPEVVSGPAVAPAGVEKAAPPRLSQAPIPVEELGNAPDEGLEWASFEEQGAQPGGVAARVGFAQDAPEMILPVIEDRLVGAAVGAPVSVAADESLEPAADVSVWAGSGEPLAVVVEDPPDAGASAALEFVAADSPEAADVLLIPIDGLATEILEEPPGVAADEPPAVVVGEWAEAAASVALESVVAATPEADAGDAEPDSADGLAPVVCEVPAADVGGDIPPSPVASSAPADFVPRPAAGFDSPLDAGAGPTAAFESEASPTSEVGEADGAGLGAAGESAWSPPAVRAFEADSEVGANDAETESPIGEDRRPSVLDDLVGRPSCRDDVPLASELLLGSQAGPASEGADDRLARQPAREQPPVVTFEEGPDRRGVSAAGWQAPFDLSMEAVDHGDMTAPGSDDEVDAEPFPAAAAGGADEAVCEAADAAAREAAGPAARVALHEAPHDAAREATHVLPGRSSPVDPVPLRVSASGDSSGAWTLAADDGPLPIAATPAEARAEDDRVARWARQVEADAEAEASLGGSVSRPAAARIRSRTTVASRRARPAGSRRGVVMAALVVIVVALAAAGSAFWWSARAGEAATGTLVVTSEPAGTDVRIDGDPRGQTPLTLDLPPGRHRVEVRGIGESKVAEVELSAGQAVTQAFTFDLASLSGALEVTSRAAGIDVYVDGQHKGTAPLTVSDLPLGIHTVMLRGPRGETQHDVTIEAAKTARLDAAETGWVRVQAPLDLQVLEKGLVIGTVSGGPIPLSPGVHRLDFANTEVAYRSSQVVQVAAGQTARITLDLPMGSVTLTSTPPSEVWIDGVRVGETPISSLSMPLGPHEVAFRHSRLGEMRYGFTVTLASPVRMSVDFKK